jgi:hypothetical protein
MLPELGASLGFTYSNAYPAMTRKMHSLSEKNQTHDHNQDLTIPHPKAFPRLG